MTVVLRTEYCKVVYVFHIILKMFLVFREYIFAVDNELEQSSFTARQTVNT